jgi:7-carboxy-7-deazaguanine synthase
MSTVENSTGSPLQLRITEIFFSLQGESASVGIPTVFIRLTGCPLRCQYCDTVYAFTGGQQMELADIMRQVEHYHTRYITVTGGEPLAQKACRQLLTALCDKGYKVSLETSGAIDVSEVDERVVKVMDIKTPGSGEQTRNLWSNLAHINANDQLKFVLCDRNDYEWACGIVNEHKLSDKAEILFSPSCEQLNASQLADWILHDQLPVRFQLQLHKILWGNQPGR